MLDLCQSFYKTARHSLAALFIHLAVDMAQILAWKKSIPCQKRDILKLFWKKCSFKGGKSKETDARRVTKLLQDLQAPFGTALHPFGTRIPPIKLKKWLGRIWNPTFWLKSSIDFSLKSTILMVESRRKLMPDWYQSFNKTSRLILAPLFSHLVPEFLP